MWVFTCGMGIAVLVMYVGDGGIGGPEEVVNFIIGRFQEFYMLEVEDGLSLIILGVTVSTIIRDGRILVAFRMTG